MYVHSYVHVSDLIPECRIQKWVGNPLVCGSRSWGKGPAGLRQLWTEALEIKWKAGAAGGVTSAVTLRLPTSFFSHHEIAVSTSL